MQHDTALLFQFPDGSAASLAADTLKELGYEPDIHDGRSVHVHLHGSDLTSALEIMQSHGGTLASQTAIDDCAITSTAYSLDAIPIPAHLVNEDLIAGEDGGQAYGGHADNDDFLPDPGTCDHFPGDVHI